MGIEKWSWTITQLAPFFCQIAVRRQSAFVALPALSVSSAATVAALRVEKAEISRPWPSV